MLVSELELIDTIENLKKRGWVKAAENNLVSAGGSFGDEMVKLPDELFINNGSDYEIKCVTSSNDKPMHLFFGSFDGGKKFELIRLVEKYGWKDRVGSITKSLFFRGNCCYKYSPNKNGYKFKFDIDYEKKLLRLQVFDRNDAMIDNKSYISFESLEKSFYNKLKKIALVWATRKSIFGKDYYKYYRVCFYKNKGFENFVDLLGKGIVDIGIYGKFVKEKTGEVYFKSKNMDFRISRRHMERLFECYYDSLENA